MIRLSKSTVGEREAQALAAVISDGRLGMGSFVEKFEKELAAFIGGGRHVLCVNSGTAALQLAVQACGIGPGDEVLIPTITYIASFQAVSATGASPIACDVSPTTLCLDAADAAKKITARTRAIMPVHYASGPGDLDAVYDLARQHGLRVIEDAAHAFGGFWKGRRVGATGDLVCFSFDGIKNITAGEGGAVVTSDPEVARRIGDARLLGVEKDTEKRYQGQRSWEFDATAQGWRYHMSNLCAAIGSVQLRRLDTEFAPKRVVLARRYEELLAGAPQIRTLELDYGAVVPHIFPILIADGRRDAVRQALLDNEIECGIHYKPNHLLTLYGGGSTKLPVAEDAYSRMLTLPLHVELTAAEQQRIVQIIRDVPQEQPTISVLMSVRNGMPYVEQTVQSILAQTFADFEFIIVDNASTDGSALAIEKIAQRDSRITLLRNAQDLGMSGGLNRGLEVGSGRWIARMDADDIAQPDRFERQLEFLADNPDVKVTSCLAYYIDETGKQVGKTFHDLTSREVFERYIKEDLAIGILHPGAMIDRRILSDAGGYRQEYFPANDIDLWGRIADAGGLILVQPEYLMQYRVHAGSATAQGFKNARLKYQWARDSMRARRRGLPEPAWDAYVESRLNAPWWKRLNRWRKTNARRLYRQAAQNLLSRKAVRAAAEIFAATLLQPTYTVPRLKGQLLK
jgi:dTDP-4-amino-4,6-dideoxygalactose transaminase